jgi:hypothetical protein
MIKGMTRLLVVLVALVAVAAGCTADTAGNITAAIAPPSAVIAGWHETTLPAPGARILAITPNGNGLLVLGSVPGPQGRAPGAWTTTDGKTWHAVPLQPHTPYAFQAELALVGSAGGRVTVLGEAFGGAHSNPRLTLWTGSVAGLVEYEQPFEMFGGPHAIATNDAAALPGTALLVGQWDGSSGRYGAAVWTSPNGSHWTRNMNDPALASAAGEQTSALGAAAGPMGFLVAGDTVHGANLAPLAWTSPDGKAWQRIVAPSVPATGQYGGATADQATCEDTGCALIGTVVGQQRTVLCWPVGDTGGKVTIGAVRMGPSGTTMQVSQAFRHNGTVFAAIRLNNTARLVTFASDCTGSRDLTLPVVSREARIGALPNALLLATTDLTVSRLWLR